MNRIIINKSEVSHSGAIHLVSKGQSEDTRAEHILHHLGAKVGSQLKVTIPDMGLGVARVEKIGPTSGQVELQLISKMSELEQGARRYIHLWVARCRPPSAKKIIEHSVGLPVKTITFFDAILGDKSFKTSKVYKQDTVQKLLTDGLSQAGNYHTFPTVELKEISLKHLIHEGHHEDQLTHFLDCERSSLLSSISSPDRKSIDKGHKELFLAIGPERGWSQTELELLKRANFVPTHLGSGIHRVEIACFVALGQVEMLVLASQDK